MYNVVLFDFFGVIRTDAYQSWLDRQGIKREGMYHEVTERLDAGEINLDTMLELVGQASGLPVTLEILDESATVDTDVVDLIDEVGQYAQVGLVSNAESAFIRNLLREHDLERRFDEIIISSEVGHIKPRPEIFQIALERMQSSPEVTLFTDDNETHVAAAAELGITSLLFRSADQLRRDLTRLGVLH
jgi:HAD superfamily hydrolase (TIGR01509 family)